MSPNGAVVERKPLQSQRPFEVAGESSPVLLHSVMQTLHSESRSAANLNHRYHPATNAGTNNKPDPVPASDSPAACSLPAQHPRCFHSPRIALQGPLPSYPFPFWLMLLHTPSHPELHALTLAPAPVLSAALFRTPLGQISTTIAHEAARNGAINQSIP